MFVIKVVLIFNFNIPLFQKRDIAIWLFGIVEIWSTVCTRPKEYNYTG